jgi:hypothetical protein
MGYDYVCKVLPADIPGGDLDAVVTNSKCPLYNPMNMSLKEFCCPSNSHSIYRDQNTATLPPQFAFTNYKAMGTSTRNSLLLAVSPSAPPPYGTSAMHPDGAVFPSNADIPLASVTDGTAHTIFIMETCDDRGSRWMVGAECTLVGLPYASSPTGTTPGAGGSIYPYFYPPGYVAGNWGDSFPLGPPHRTFLMYDFSPAGADTGKYEDPGWAKTQPAYGPSSMHPAIVVVGFGDGSAVPLSKRTDAANLFFLITKSNHDPFYLP